MVGVAFAEDEIAFAVFRMLQMRQQLLGLVFGDLFEQCGVQQRRAFVVDPVRRNHTHRTSISDRIALDHSRYIVTRLAAAIR